MSALRLAAATVVSTALAVSRLHAQAAYDPYDQIYGPPVDVALADLAQGIASYEAQPVRTRGTVDVYMAPGASLSSTSRTYVLREGGFSILLVPRPEVAADWSYEAQGQLGRRVEVTGHYSSSSSLDMVGPSGVLEFWRFARLGDEGDARRARAHAVTVESLLTRSEQWKGRLVRVAGEFRGRNLYGDLASATQRGLNDWVLKDDLHALWITGKPPRGDGFRLDPGLRRDTGKWLEVVGRVEVVKGAPYVRASVVALAMRPAREAPSAPALPERPKEPPQVVFSLPLDGETEVASATRFAVQFSKDMDESTFAGRVALRYAGATQAGDTAFGHLAATYDAGLRTLTVDPGDPLRAGRIVELLLLPGIADLDGLALAARPGRSVAGAADILRFSVGP